MILVTSYENPDLDGAACALAYAELLKKQSKDAKCAILGNLQLEANFVLDKLKLTIPQIREVPDEVILVDASLIQNLHSGITKDKVIEIIDHRKINDSQSFTNAKVQIELVGSCATLIAERFFNSKVPISAESALLLYSAIVSNTINFKANVTTDRDRKMADWLKSHCNIENDFVKEMFAYKSKINKPLLQVFFDDMATFTFGGKKLSICQLEIVNSEEFVNKNKTELFQALKALKDKEKLDIIFLNCIDLEKGFNTLAVIDEFTQNLIEKILNIKFTNQIAHTNKIIMRKEISPLLKEALTPSP